MSDKHGQFSKHDFEARHCGVDDSKFAVSVGFARDPADEKSLDGLILQRGKDKAEKGRGIDGVYSEIPIQRHVVYGGIREASLSRELFVVRFDESAAKEMAHFEEIAVRLKLTDSKFAEIRDALRSIFAGCDCFREEG